MIFIWSPRLFHTVSTPVAFVSVDVSAYRASLEA